MRRTEENLVSGRTWWKRSLVLSSLLIGCMAMGWSGSAPAQEPLGGEFSLIFGGSSGPFKTKTNFFLGGALDVPIYTADPVAGQSLLGEVMVGWSRTHTQLRSVSPLVAVGAPAAAVTSTRFEVTTFQVALDFKYKLDKLWAPIAPYIVLGPSFYVFLDNTSGAALGGDFAGGIAPQATQIQAVNFPAGQGSVEVGVNMGVGLDVHLTKRLLVGAEYRYNALTKADASHSTFGGRIGLRF